MLRLLGCSLLFFCLACTPSTEGDIPFDTDRLSSLVVDLHLMEALCTEIPVTLRDSMKAVYSENIFSDHEFEKQEFDSLMWIVRKEPAWVETFFREVSDKIAKLDAEANRTPPSMETN